MKNNIIKCCSNCLLLPLQQAANNNFILILYSYSPNADVIVDTGGDVPPYMLKEIFSMQNKRVVIDEQPLDEDEEDEEVPVRGPNGFPPKRNVGGPMPKNSDLNPLSKLMSPLRDILPRNWFQEEKEKSGVHLTNILQAYFFTKVFCSDFL